MTVPEGLTDEQVADMSPLDRLTACYAECPDPMRAYLDRCIGEAVPHWLNRAQALISMGYRLPTGDKLPTMEETYAAGIAKMDELMPESRNLHARSRAWPRLRRTGFHTYSNDPLSK